MDTGGPGIPHIGSLQFCGRFEVPHRCASGVDLRTRGEHGNTREAGENRYIEIPSHHHAVLLN
jgi:hypothetical protein